MAEERTAATPLLGGTIDRREFLTGVAALAAGALAAANEAHAQAPAPGSRPRFIDFHHHFQSPEWVKYANANGVRVPQFEREPGSNIPSTPPRGIEARDKPG